MTHPERASYRPLPAPPPPPYCCPYPCPYCTLPVLTTATATTAPGTCSETIYHLHISSGSERFRKCPISRPSCSSVGVSQNSTRAARLDNSVDFLKLCHTVRTCSSATQATRLPGMAQAPPGAQACSRNCPVSRPRLSSAASMRSLSFHASSTCAA